MATSQFERALAKKKDAAKRLDEAKKAKPSGGNFQPPTIEDGSYIAEIGASTGVSPNANIPFIRFDWKVLEGDYEGTAFNETIFLQADDEEREQKSWDKLSRSLQVLTGEDADSWDIGHLGDIIEDIDSAKPKCRIGLRNWKGQKSSGISVFFNELLKGEVAKDAEEATSNMEPPRKGDVFDYMTEDGEEVEVEVKTVNSTKETCTLNAIDSDETYTAVPWSELKEVVQA